jgi:energy-coupling factor transporter ATP-binding protein EcfA2
VPLIAGLSAGLLTIRLLWHDAPNVWLPLLPGSFGEHLVLWLRGLLAMLTHGQIGAEAWQNYTRWLTQLEPAGLRWALYARIVLGGLSATGAATLALIWLLQGDQGDKPLRGRPLRTGLQGLQALAAEAAREWNGDKPGIKLHPKVTISQIRETKHLLIMGASGSGKTHIVWQVLQEALQRKDRVVLFDSKGDFTSELKSIGLLAPWDARSRAWDIASDCPGPLDARALAARMIPTNDKDPMWSNASREVLATLIMHLQHTKPGQWTFPDLRAGLNLPLEGLRALAQQHNPEALRSLDEGSKTTQSILINMAAFMAPVVDFSKAWNHSDTKRFSMRRWIEGNSSLPRTIVMQGSQRFEQTTSTLVNSLLSVMAATIASPSLRDDPDRRIWLILDEFPQLGLLKDIGPLIRMGRSKGLRIVIGAQDIAELRAIYGTHQADAWTSSLTTSIYTRLEGGGTAEWVSRRIGEQELEEISDSKTHTGHGTSETQQVTLRRTPTVLPSQLKSLVGTRPDGVDALIDGFDSAVYLVRYPYHQSKPIRAGSVNANWVEPEVQSPTEATAQAALITPVEQAYAANDEQFEPNNSQTGDTDSRDFTNKPAAHAASSPKRPRRWTKRPSEYGAPPSDPDSGISA